MRPYFFDLRHLIQKNLGLDVPAHRRHSPVTRQERSTKLSLTTQRWSSMETNYKWNQFSSRSERQQDKTRTASASHCRLRSAGIPWVETKFLAVHMTTLAVKATRAGHSSFSRGLGMGSKEGRRGHSARQGFPCVFLFWAKVEAIERKRVYFEWTWVCDVVGMYRNNFFSFSFSHLRRCG